MPATFDIWIEFPDGRQIRRANRHFGVDDMTHAFQRYQRMVVALGIATGSRFAIKAKFFDY